MPMPLHQPATAEWSDDELRGTGLTVADIEEIEALARRLNEMPSGELAELRAEIDQIEASPDSTPVQMGFAAVLGAGCRALARGENPEPVLTMLLRMRTWARQRDPRAERYGDEETHR